MKIGDKYQVDVIQYLRPDGRLNHTFTHLPVETQPKYKEMVEAGCRFEAEVLINSQVSVTIFDGGEDYES